MCLSYRHTKITYFTITTTDFSQQPSPSLTLTWSNAARHAAAQPSAAHSAPVVRPGQCDGEPCPLPSPKRGAMAHWATAGWGGQGREQQGETRERNNEKHQRKRLKGNCWSPWLKKGFWKTKGRIGRRPFFCGFSSTQPTLQEPKGWWPKLTKLAGIIHNHTPWKTNEWLTGNEIPTSGEEIYQKKFLK